MIDQAFDRHRTPFAAYLHIPFCLSKCLYCDFNSYPNRNGIFDAYTNAVIQDIYNSPDGPALETIYFGGGTPTVIGAERLCDILQAVVQKYSITNDAEISVEANPGTIIPDMLLQMRDSGFNRLSLGAQSFQDCFLEILGRAHNAEQISIALDAIRAAGFLSVSLDLMYGLPGQNISDWLLDLENAVSMEVEHISAYELTVEESTPLAHSVADGNLQLSPEELQIEMLNQTQVVLTQAGFERYEVSNYCKQGYECRHNLKYWRNEAHWGFGAGAVGYSGGVRSVRLLNPDRYIESVTCGSEPVQATEAVTGQMFEAETLMMGFRLASGIDICVLDAMSQKSRDTAEKLIAAKLLVVTGDRLVATPEGYLKLNDVAEAFLP